MPANLEIKIRVRDFVRLRRLLRRMGARRVAIFNQRDSYFALGRIRAKLREEPGRNELIVYDRPTRSGSRTSEFEVVSVQAPRLWKRAFRALRTVSKRRELWRHRRTRIHLDRVRGLGTYLELETQGAGRAEFDFMMRSLGLSNRDGIAGSYAEL